MPRNSIMKKILFLTALIGTYSSEHLEAMGERDIPSQTITLSSCIKLKSFLLELASLCCEEDSLETKDLLRLIRYVKTDKIAQLFGIDQATIRTYFHATALKKFVECILNIDAPSEKALAFKKSFKIEAWHRECECAQELIDLLSKILFFEGSGQEYRELLQVFKHELAALSENSTQKISRFIDIKSLIEHLEAREQGTQIATVPITITVHHQPLLELLPVEAHYAHLSKALTLLVTLCCAQSREEFPTFFDLCGCIDWNTVLHELPQRLGYEEKIILLAFDKDKLAELIVMFQAGKTITAAAIERCFNTKLFEWLHIDHETLPQYLNCELLATGFNNVR